MPLLKQMDTLLEKPPMVLYLGSGRPHENEISKEGYKSELIVFKKGVKWEWQIVDAVTTVFVGNLTDLATLNGYRLSPDDVFVALSKEE